MRSWRMGWTVGGLVAAAMLLAGTGVGGETARDEAPMMEKQDLFKSGQYGYKLFHIPGVVVTPKGTLLVWCEARKQGKSDWDSIDILMRRSVDGGRNWSEPKRIAAVDGPMSKNPVTKDFKGVKSDQVTYSNPVMIAGRDGVIHFLFCLEYMRCFYSRSADDGVTWSRPVEITAAARSFRPVYDWKVFATGPGHGIQLRNGRLVVPVWLSLQGGFPSVSSTIYSDDNGRTWKAGQIAVPHAGPWRFPNECTVAELADGGVMLNARSESKERRRLVVTSPDGATGWSQPRFDEALLDPACMGSLLRYSFAENGRGRSRLLFSNPASIDTPLDKGGKFCERKNLAVRMSYDEGRTWPVMRVLEPGGSGYSDLAAAPDGTIYCFYGRGDRRDHGGYAFKYLTLARFNLTWLTGGKDRP